ncbi:hypothetical protein RB195_009004 [Necator americanus]|uniref:Uncharacterized protein n=1 Tax=Necator americanus TaxID=51031 RepID=A0ABR1CS51_NECAM
MYALARQFTTYEDDSKEYALLAILLNKLPRRIRSRIYDEGKNQENLVPTELLRILTKIVRKETTLEEMEDHRDYTNELYMNAAYQRHYKTNTIPNTEKSKFSGQDIARSRDPCTNPRQRMHPSQMVFAVVGAVVDVLPVVVDEADVLPVVVRGVVVDVLSVIVTGVVVDVLPVVVRGVVVDML